MTKTKVFGRYIRMYVFQYKKRFSLILRDVFVSRSPIKRFDVTTMDIDRAGDALDKVFKVIDSCKYVEQTEGAEQFINLYKEQFPFAVVIEKILKRKVEKKRLTLEYWKHVD
jgi:hypothetical protein